MTSQNGNLGTTSLRRRNRAQDPMQSYDRLPPALRAWVANAALPWSPASCLRLWRKAMAQGATEAEALGRLTKAEAVLLDRDQSVWRNT